MKIIILEDNLNKAEKVNEVITNYFNNISVDTVNSKIDARRKMQENKYTVLILDMQVPERPGMEPKNDGGISFLDEIIKSPKIIKPNYIIGLTAYEILKKKFPDNWQCIHYDPNTSIWQTKLTEKLKYIIESATEVNIHDYFEKIKAGENHCVEFKETMQCPVLSKKDKLELKKYQEDSVRTQKIKELLAQKEKDAALQKELNHQVLKTICAFANSDGGELFIGVNDDSQIVGIEMDLKLLTNKDGMCVKLDNLISTYLGNPFHSLVEYIFINDLHHEVLVIKVKKSKNPHFVKEQDKMVFYYRAQASSRILEGKELLDYHKNHFPVSAT